MTTVVILVLTHVAAFILGALVFRNNSKAVEPVIDSVESKINAVDAKVAEVKKVI